MCLTHKQKERKKKKIVVCVSSLIQLASGEKLILNQPLQLSHKHAFIILRGVNNSLSKQKCTARTHTSTIKSAKILGIHEIKKTIYEHICKGHTYTHRETRRRHLAHSLKKSDGVSHSDSQPLLCCQNCVYLSPCVCCLCVCVHVYECILACVHSL